MKKILIIGCILFLPLSVFAQFSADDASVSSNGNSASMEVDAINLDNVKRIDAENSSPQTLLSTTTAYTILSIDWYDTSIEDAPTLYCGSTELTPDNNLENNPIGNSTDISFLLNYNQHCTTNLTVSDPNDVQWIGIILYVPYDTRFSSSALYSSVRAYDPDSDFFLALILFVIAIAFWHYLFKYFYAFND